MEYFDFSESEEEEDEDKSLIKRKEKMDNNNSENMENIVKGLISIKTVLFSLFLMGSVLAL
jgi:hypothetical protein